MTGRLHADEADINVGLVRRLVDTQFPRWSGLPLEAVSSAGTDNALFRLGADMVVRLPRLASVAAQVDKEHTWLPRLAPYLSLAAPRPLAKGAPGVGYPWAWSVCTWLEGDLVTLDHIGDARQLATDLARFVRSLQRIDTTGGPLPGAHNFGRGVPLAERDAATREAIVAAQGLVDSAAVTAAWNAALAAPACAGPPVWIHGDLQSGNLLARGGWLNAVIDFGGLALGDPACDLQVAWNLLNADSRAVFRAALAVDDATWLRGRGWALSVALIALPYYHTTNPTLASQARYAIAEVLAAPL